MIIRAGRAPRASASRLCAANSSLCGSKTHSTLDYMSDVIQWIDIMQVCFSALMVVSGAVGPSFSTDGIHFSVGHLTDALVSCGRVFRMDLVIRPCRALVCSHLNNVAPTFFSPILFCPCSARLAGALGPSAHRITAVTQKV